MTTPDHRAWLQDYPDDEDYNGQTQCGWFCGLSRGHFANFDDPGDIYVTRRPGEKYTMTCAFSLFFAESLGAREGYKHLCYPNGYHVTFSHSDLTAMLGGYWAPVGSCRKLDLAVSPYTSNGADLLPANVWAAVHARALWDGDSNTMTIEIAINRAPGEEVADQSYTLSYADVGSMSDFLRQRPISGAVSGWFSPPSLAASHTQEIAPPPSGSGVEPAFVASRHLNPFLSTYKAEQGYWYAGGYSDQITINNDDSIEVFAGGNPFTIDSYGDGSTGGTRADVGVGNFFVSAKTEGWTFAPPAGEWSGKYEAAVTLDMFIPDANGHLDVTIAMSKVSGSDDAPNSVNYRFRREGTEAVDSPPYIFRETTQYFGGINNDEDGWIVEPRHIIGTLNGLSGIGADQTFDVVDNVSAEAIGEGRFYPYIFLNDHDVFDGREFEGQWSHDITLTSGNLPTDWRGDGRPNGDGLIAYGAHRLSVRTHNTTSDGDEVEYWMELPLQLAVYFDRAQNYALDGNPVMHRVTASVSATDHRGRRHYVFTGSAFSANGIGSGMTLQNDYGFTAAITAEEDAAIYTKGGTLTLTAAP